MATGILALLDDVATLLDDAAIISKVAVKKTAGLLGDDLAVNTEKATGFRASRELPVVWAITKGSFINKAIIVPSAFLLTAYLPWVLVPILLAGGAYLSYEGAEKILEWLTPHDKPEPAARELTDPRAIVAEEKTKIKSAIRTDFILSIEIVVITLGIVIDQPPAIQGLVVSAISILATVGVYGLVALLVRMDDVGFFLLEWSAKLTDTQAKITAFCGTTLIRLLPQVIRMLGIIGVIAMLLVGGGIYTHNLEFVHHLVAALPGLVADMITGLIVGAVLVLLGKILRASTKAISAKNS